MISKKVFAIVLASGMAGTLLAGTAIAKPGVKIGSLKCSVEGGIGAIITSAKEIGCTLYKLNGKKEHYNGVIRKFGLDIGITGKAKMVWLVFAPTKVKRRALRGTYVGASADASLVVGGGAKVLVGGFKKSITLQPVSLQVQTGVNVAVGVTTLELR